MKLTTLFFSFLFLSSCTVYRFKTPVRDKEELTIIVHYQKDKRSAVVKNPAYELLQADTSKSKLDSILVYLSRLPK